FAHADEALEIEQKLAAAERQAANLEERIARARRLYIDDNDEGARGDVERLRGEKAELQSRIEALHAGFHKAKGAVSPSEHVRRIKQFIGLINDDDSEIRLD